MQKSLNDITPAELEEVRKLAGIFFTPKEIAMVMEFEIAPFIEACAFEGSHCFIAFMGGRLKSLAELRTSVVTLAKSGSSPAQTMAIEMLNQSTIKMMDK